MQAGRRLRSCRCQNTQVRYRYLRIRRCCRNATTLALNLWRGQLSPCLFAQIRYKRRDWLVCVDCGGCAEISSYQSPLHFPYSPPNSQESGYKHEETQFLTVVQSANFF